MPPTLLSEVHSERCVLVLLRGPPWSLPDVVDIVLLDARGCGGLLLESSETREAAVASIVKFKQRALFDPHNSMESLSIDPYFRPGLVQMRTMLCKMYSTYKGTKKSHLTITKIL